MDTNNVHVSPNLGKVVVFTNIDDQDFEHAFGGQPFRILAGQSQNMPFDLADHLATHLARKILLRNDKGKNFYDPTDKSGGTGSPIWGVAEEQALKSKILGNTYQVDRPRTETEVERLQREVKELNQFVRSNMPGISTAPVVTPAVASEAVPSVDVPLAAPADQAEHYETKADVIAKLTSLGIKFDARQNKDKLLQHLNTQLKQ